MKANRSRRTLLTQWYFAVLFLFILWQTVMLLSPFMKAIYWAAILAFSFFPLYQWLRRKRGLSDTAAAITVTLLFVIVVVPPVVMLIVHLSAQAAEWGQEVIEDIQSGRFATRLDQLQNIGFVQQLKHWVIQWEPLKQDAQEWALSGATTVGNAFARRAGRFTRHALFAPFNAALALWLFFIFLKHGQRMLSIIYQLTPLAVTHKRVLFDQVNETLSAVIRGQLLTSSAQALVSGFLFWVLGISYPLLLGLLTFVATLLPMGGAGLVWLPLSIYLAIEQHYTRAILLFLAGAGIISLMDNVLRVILIGEKTRLPYVLLFLSILGGVQAYGVLGLFLGPVVLSVLFVLITIYRSEFWNDLTEQVSKSRGDPL